MPPLTIDYRGTRVLARKDECGNVSTALFSDSRQAERWALKLRREGYSAHVRRAYLAKLYYIALV
jgi:hypothetical protein